MTHVLFVTEGFQHLTAARLLASAIRAAGIGSAVFFPHKIDEAMKWSEFDFVINDVLAVPGFLKHARAVVLFTSETSPHCLISVRISMLAKKTGAKVLVIQHGLIQPGLNYFARSRSVGFLPGGESSYAISHFDNIIEWQGDQGIGCIGLKREVEIKIPNKETQIFNVLVSTNFNWSALSDEDAFHFFKMLIRLKEKLPYLNFFHKGHPAENIRALARRLGLVNLESLFFIIDRRASFDSALVGMDIAVTTPSTTIIDCINAAVPVFVFDAPRLRGVYSELDNVKFTNFQELLERFVDLIENRVYQLPRFKPFDENKFVEIIKDRISVSGEFEINEEHFLQYVSSVTSAS